MTAQELPDIRQTWGVALKPPFPQHAQEFADLCRAIHEGRDSIATCLDQFLFGFETASEKAYNDTAEFARTWMPSVSEAIFGESAERPSPHTRLQLLRAGGRGVDASAAPVQNESSSGQLTTSVLNSYSDMSLLATLFLLNPEAPDAFRNLKVLAAIGSHEKAVEQVLRMLVAGQMSLARLASKDGGCQGFKAALMNAFKESTGIASRVVNIAETRFKKEEVRDGVVRISFESPIDYESLQSHYGSLADALQILDPLLLRLRRRQDGAILADVSKEDGVIWCSVHFLNGELVWLGDTIEPVRWDGTDVFTFDTEVECCLNTIGVSMAAIPFPIMKFQVEMCRKGSIVITCIEANESQFENVASLAFDLEQFRKLLTKDFRAEVRHVPPKSESEGWTIQALLNVPFPTSSVVTALTQWFRSYVTDQFTRLDTMKALAHLIAALSKDATMLSAKAAEQAPAAAT
jgi:hypothetical protein